MSVFVAGRIAATYHDDQTGVSLARRRCIDGVILERMSLDVSDLQDLEYVVSRLRDKQMRREPTLSV